MENVLKNREKPLAQGVFLCYNSTVVTIKHIYCIFWWCFGLEVVREDSPDFL